MDSLDPATLRRLYEYVHQNKAKVRKPAPPKVHKAQRSDDIPRKSSDHKPKVRRDRDRKQFSSSDSSGSGSDLSDIEHHSRSRSSHSRSRRPRSRSPTPPAPPPPSLPPPPPIKAQVPIPAKRKSEKISTNASSPPHPSKKVKQETPWLSQPASALETKMSFDVDQDVDATVMMAPKEESEKSPSDSEGVGRKLSDVRSFFGIAAMLILVHYGSMCIHDRICILRKMSAWKTWSTGRCLQKEIIRPSLQVVAVRKTKRRWTMSGRNTRESRKKRTKG